MEYLHEHTWAGQLGHLLVITAFVTSIAGTYCYVLGRHHDLSGMAWRQFGGKLFAAHSLAVIGVVSLLFFMIANHFFEYHYVWKYSNLSMEPKYIFSCFWSGQEGSLLLWSFWIVVLAGILLTTSGDSGVRAVPFVLLVQAFIFSMLLGVYIGDVKIGNSPFILIRELPENVGMPWAKMHDYLERITSFQDGVGLNPLLQNYWMTIHPPVLFLGFAATLFPFAIALGSRQGKLANGAWIKVAIVWTIFGVMTLGAGILLGGAWAYESLSFGGFWAWDPVENASLVPWIVLVAGLHCLQITRKSNRASYMALLFSTAPFLLVLYASFLTRSGVLGESSVHSFTENGLSLHLLIFNFTMTFLTVWLVVKSREIRLAFAGLSLLLFIGYLISGSLAYTLPAWFVATLVVLIVYYEKYFSEKKAPMSPTSREFWMLAGVFFLLISALQITISTSIPVINGVFGTRLDAFTEITSRNLFYHNWQIPVAVMLILLVGATQYLRYRNSDLRAVWVSVRKPLYASMMIFVLLLAVLQYHPITEWRFFLLLAALSLALVLTFTYSIRIWKNSLIGDGGTVAHIGFALLLLGALISGSRKSIVSENRSNFALQELNENFRNSENILLRQGDTTRMNQYFVSYRERFKEGNKLHYAIDYFESEVQGGELRPGKHAFTLHPMVQLNEQFGNVAEPGTKTALTYDVFTHIKYADMEPTHLQDGYISDGFMGETSFPIKLDSTFMLENFSFTMKDIYLIDDASEKMRDDLDQNDIVVKAIIEAKNTESGAVVMLEPLFVVRDSVNVVHRDVYSKELDARIRIAGLLHEENSLMLGIRQREFVVMQALIFPGMNVLWTGCVLMVFGCGLSLRKYLIRAKQSKEVLAHAERQVPSTMS